MPAIDVFWLNHSMAFLPDRGAPHLAASHASNTFTIITLPNTISPISQSRSVQGSSSTLGCDSVLGSGEHGSRKEAGHEWVRSCAWMVLLQQGMDRVHH